VQSNTLVGRKPLPWLLVCSTWIWPLQVSAGPAHVAAAEVEEIATGVYVRPSRAAMLFEADAVANAGFVVGERCVAVVDTGGSVAEGRALAAAISRVTEVEVCFVINTHVHPDHMLGNAAFQRDGVEFIGHENLPRAMAMRGDIYRRRAAEFTGEEESTLSIVPPERMVSGTVQLDLGRRMLTLQAHAAAHTDGDLSVLDEQTGTLFAGDLVFLEHVPVLDGSINGWLEELAALMREPFSHVVPGHGPTRVDWPQAGTPTVNYLAGLREATRSWIAGGGDLGAAQQGIEATEPERWQLIERYHKRNVAAAFAELEWED
jgi:quinoprotein relay system zinc metallohydrolase 2